MRLPRPRPPGAQLAHLPRALVPYGRQTADPSAEEPSVARPCCARLRQCGVAEDSHSHVRGDLGVGLGSDAINLLQFLNPAEPPVLLPPGENRLGSDRSDSGQLF